MRIFFMLMVWSLGLGNSFVGLAQQKTTIVVRAKAQDAKLIGTSMGSALITIKNAETGELLTKGLTEGSTGNTEKLVLSSKKRYEQISTEESAKFVAELALEKPIFVTVSATAPMDYEQAQVTSSTQLWLIPGKDIIGDGIILELPGFVVDLLKPKKKVTEPSIPIRAKIVMMCGCPTKPGGTWDSSAYEIEALIYRNAEKVGEIPLTFSGKTSVFEGVFQAKQPGNYTLMVYAYHSTTGNTGLDKVKVVVK